MVLKILIRKSSQPENRIVQYYTNGQPNTRLPVCMNGVLIILTLWAALRCP